MTILNKISLKPFNSFRVDAKADYFVSIHNIDDIFQLIETEVFKNNKYFILGSGSNVLFAEDFKGVVINVEIKGMSIIKSTDDYLILEVGAGEDWNNFVRTCINSNYYGIENLALIPGKVGAAPVQNIGAYEAEQKNCFVALKGVNLQTKELIEMNFADCKFGYRSSIFKEELKDKFLITSVQYKLSRQKKFNFSYKELEIEVNKFPVKEIDLLYVYDTICRLRTSKLPDMNIIGSAGSFFKNPIVDTEVFERIKNDYLTINGYPSGDGKLKLSAGWLIEQCGWKGKRIGDAGIYDKHALVLVNYGKATGKEILSLSNQIKESVLNKFGVELEEEVLILQ
ncbi:MAG: UDP-N-acetylmuramate dehydrogenase [bacterium]